MTLELFEGIDVRMKIAEKLMRADCSFVLTRHIERDSFRRIEQGKMMNEVSGCRARIRCFVVLEDSRVDEKG